MEINLEELQKIMVEGFARMDANAETNKQQMQALEARIAAIETRSHRSTPVMEPAVAFESPKAEPQTPPAQPPVAESPPMFGPTGLPFTPAPGKEDKPQKRPDRRETIHLHNLKSAEASARVPVVHGLLASYDHITYKKSSLHQFYKFWDAVKLYELKEATKLPVTAIIDEMIRESLISSDLRRLGNGRFFELSHEELYTIMQAEFRPTDCLDFMKQLEANVEFEFSAHFRPSPEYFKPFYDALLIFISKFSQIYDILVHGIRGEDIIPRCDNKPGGLVKAFAAKIPFEYGTRCLLLLPKNRWDALSDFLKDFRALLDVHKGYAECARKLRRCFGGTQYESKKFDQKLQRLQELRALPHDPGLYDDEWHDAFAAAAEELDQDVDTMLAAAMQQTRGKDFPQKPHHGKDGPPRDPLVCITKLLHGTCTKPQCSYAHKEDLVQKKRYEFLDLIQKQIAASRGAQRGIPPQNAAAMEDKYDDEEEY